jgi:hypothetical protein
MFLFLWVFFCASLVFHRSNIWFETSSGDSAFLAETVTNIYTKGTSNSIAAQSALRVVYGGYLTADADTVEQLGTGNIDENKSVLKAHAYWFLYLASYLHAFMDVPLLLSALVSISFMVALGVCYYLIRALHGSPLLAGIFCVLVASHPFWREPLLHGQDYVDRYYIGLGSLLLLSLFKISVSRGWGSWGAVVGCLILTCSLSERIALISGAIVGARGAWFLWRREFRTALILMVMGTLGVVYGVVQIRYVLESHSYSTFLSLNSFLHPIFVTDANARAKTILFLLINAPLLLLALRAPFWGGIAIVTMIPNIFGNIGGAEKVGWSTHYHSTYIPALMFAAAYGISRVGRPIRILGFGLMLICFVFVDPYQTTPITLSSASMRTRLVALLPWEAWTNYRSGYYDALARTQMKFEEAVPKGVVVSTPEFGMGRLIFGRTVYFFPMGLDKADVVLLTSCANKPPLYCGYASFLADPVEKGKLNELMLRKMQALGFDIDNPQEIVPSIYAFKKFTPSGAQ